MDFQSIEEVVQFAIDKEAEAASFYKTAAEQEAIQSNKNVLEEYANEEEKHEKMLKDFSFDKAAVAQYRFQKINDLKRADYLVDMTYTPRMTYYQTMRVAMKREEKAYKLYQDLAKSAENENMTNIFNILAHEELKHKNALETIYDDHLAKTGD